MKYKYYRNEPKFSDVYSRNNLPKIKDGTYVINLEEFKSIGTQWIALHVDVNNIIYFDSFGVENIREKKIQIFIGNKNIITNIYKIQASDSVVCEYFCIRFINFILKGKSLFDYQSYFLLMIMRRMIK